MKKISSAGIKNIKLKKIQPQVEGSLRSSSKKLKINNDYELPSITMSMSPNIDKIRKKSFRLRQNLNVSNSHNSKQFKQNGLSSIKNKLLFITKKPQNVISKPQKNDSLYLNAEIKVRANIKNPSFSPHQNKIYHDTIQYGPPRSKEKIEKKKRSESVKENKEVLQHNIKLLFNHIQNRLKTKKNRNIELKHNQSCFEHNFTQLITFSQFFTTAVASKSLLSSPRFQLFERNEKKNHHSGAYIVNLAQEIERLQSLENKNQDSLKMLINEQIGLLNLKLYKGRKKEKVKE